MRSRGGSQYYVRKTLVVESSRTCKNSHEEIMSDDTHEVDNVSEVQGDPE